MVREFALFGWLSLALLVTVGLSFVPAYQQWSLERLGRRIGLGVPVDLDASFRRRIGSRVRTGSIGGLLAVGVLAVAVATVPGLLSAQTSSITVALFASLSIAVVGSSIGVFVSALRGGAPARPDRPRVARLRATEPSDYVSPLPRRLAFVELGLAAATVVMLLVGPPLSARESAVLVPVLVLFVVSGLSIAAFPLAARRIIGRGHPSTSTDEMVWDDALRAAALRDLLSAPIQALAFGMFYGVLGASGGLPEPALIPASVGLLCCIAFVDTLRGDRGWFLHRLWPHSRRRTDDEEAERLAALKAS